MQAQSLGRFRIVKETGRDAHGRVLLGHDPETDRSVVIRLLDRVATLPASERASARERVLRDARAAQRLTHPGIVEILDLGEADGIPYLVLERVDGDPLARHTADGKLLPLEIVVELGARAAEALAYAHENGIVHGDLKPGSLIRAGERSVKVTDFGLAVDATSGYRSPEQIRGGEVDGRSDLFSLAAVLQELATGEPPFAGESEASVLYRIVHEEPREAPPERLPPALAVVLRRALAKRPEDRPGDGRSLAAELRAARLTGAPAPEAAPVTPRSPGRPSPAPRPARPGRSTRLPWIIGAGVVLGGLAIVVVVQKFAIPPEPVWLETTVRTEPPGLEVRLDGRPVVDGKVRFAASGPFGSLTATSGCRTATHVVDPADAGGEVVLVLDPDRTELVVDPGVESATVRLNRDKRIRAPASLDIDLCNENVIEAKASGYRTASVTIPAGATPLEARTLVAELGLEPIPRGRLVLPSTPSPVVFYVDGKKTRRSDDGIELFEGKHKIRAVSERHWIDVTKTVEVRGGETVEPAMNVPRLGTLVIQAFPANRRAYLRRPREKWKLLDETPVTVEIAEGSYEVRVEFRATGETKEQAIDLAPGRNPPLRFAFGRPG